MTGEMMFRENKFKKVLLFILAVIFIFSSISGVFYATGRFNIIKTKNKKIHINDFIKFLNRERNRQYTEYIQNKEDIDIEYIKSETFTRLSLEKMLYRTLLENEIDFYGISEPKKLVFEKILNDENMKNEDGKFDIYKFQSFLEQIKLTENEFLDFLKKEDEKGFLSTFYSQNIIFIPDNIIDKLYNLYNIDKEIYIITKDIKQFKFKNQLLNVTDEEINNYYENNKREFLIPKKTKISYIDFGKSDNSLEIDDYIKDKSKIMTDIAKKFNKKIVELDFIEDSKLLSKYNFLIDGTVLNDIGFTSNAIKINDKIYVYHIDDIRNQTYKTKQQVKDEIVKIFNENALINSSIDETNKIIKPLVSSGGESIFLSDKNLKKIKDAGFSIKKDIFNIDNINSLNKKFFQHLFYLKENQFTPIIFDNNTQNITFIIVAKVKKSKTEMFSKDYINSSYNHRINFSIQNNYLSYLKNKYMAKINEKLLKYIINSEK